MQAKDLPKILRGASKMKQFKSFDLGLRILSKSWHF